MLRRQHIALFAFPFLVTGCGSSDSRDEGALKTEHSAQTTGDRAFLNYDDLTWNGDVQTRVDPRGGGVGVLLFKREAFAKYFPGELGVVRSHNFAPTVPSATHYIGGGENFLIGQKGFIGKITRLYPEVSSYYGEYIGMVAEVTPTSEVSWQSLVQQPESGSGSQELNLSALLPNNAFTNTERFSQRETTEILGRQVGVAVEGSISGSVKFDPKFEYGFDVSPTSTTGHISAIGKISGTLNGTIGVKVDELTLANKSWGRKKEFGEQLVRLGSVQVPLPPARIGPVPVYGTIRIAVNAKCAIGATQPINVEVHFNTDGVMRLGAHYDNGKWIAEQQPQFAVSAPSMGWSANVPGIQAKCALVPELQLMLYEVGGPKLEAEFAGVVAIGNDLHVSADVTAKAFVGAEINPFGFTLPGNTGVKQEIYSLNLWHWQR